ncbi:glycosyltransferase family 2 protein [uncultured Bacteroides sp.]|uniref:glycosyltransferase family 2 protein n=1 Tax=uncultured Bacteroides sp. TaxID=162156 RepID=UPI00261E74B2|nr:glycosyltransferase family 2 protein [uncultured Bacteroides sp.]
MKTLELLFWLSLSVLFYTYIGYGLLLHLLVGIKEFFCPQKARPALAEAELPHLTLFITAYNEEDAVDEKMDNCLRLDYPAEKLHILWVTDGSDDGTLTRLARWKEAIVVHQSERRGKTAAMNRGMEYVKTPIVVFTDANTNLNPEALRRMVEMLETPEVGCVAGEKRIEASDKADAANGGEGIYWKYESYLKDLDGRLYSAVGAAGELFAIRRELYEQLPEDTLLDDFTLSLRTVTRGYKTAYCADAYATETGSADMHEEAKRKVRIAAGGLQAVWRLRKLMNPLRYGVFSLQYISHRVLRWFPAPLLLLALLPLNAILIFGTEGTVLYTLLWTGQLLFYLMAARGRHLARKRIKNRFLFIPYYFLFMNLCAVKGMNYLAGRHGGNGTWEKSRRSGHYAGSSPLSM